MPQAPSTRWCPTPEQLMILEEMYRSGIRTPNASQIQQITAHLSYYGRIEGKNVFYWFQNHKARDRQKLRRRLSRQQQLVMQQQQQQQQAGGGFEEVSPPLTPTAPPHLSHLGGCPETNQPMNLLSKLEADGKEEEVSMTPEMAANTTDVHAWMARMGIGGALPPCCRPLKTLDLFPTRSTGLKDECSTSKSSSCSTSSTY